MQKSTKILLGVLGSLVVVGMIVVALGVYWISTSGKQYFEQFIATSEKQIDEGKAYGKTRDDNACLQEALERINRADSIPTTMAAHFFFRGCLDACQPTPDFCRDVPATGEIIDSVKWTLRKCGELGTNANDENCKQIVKAIQQHCNKVNKKAAESSATPAR